MANGNSIARPVHGLRIISPVVAPLISRPNNRDRFMQIPTIVLPTGHCPFRRFRRIKSSIVRAEIRLRSAVRDPQELSDPGEKKKKMSLSGNIIERGERGFLLFLCNTR